MKRSIRTLLLVCLVFALAACSTKTSSTQPSQPGNQSGTMPAAAPVNATATVAPTAVPSVTATVTNTPAPTATATPVTFDSTVITSIMCLAGPAETYTRVAYLKAGDTYTTYARDAQNNYFLIQFPGNTAKTCWVWKNYVTVNGNSYTLPVATAEPATK